MNAKLNNLDQIKSVRAAVGNKTGTIDMLVSDIDTMWATTSREWADVLHSKQTPSHTRTERVPMVAIDDFVREQRISNIALMKIDVEAAELDVLAGAKQVLSEGCIGQVIVEVHSPPVDLSEVSAVLRRYNYKLEAIGNLYGIHINPKQLRA